MTVLTHSLHRAQSFLKTSHLLSKSRISSHFTVGEIPLPRSQMPVSCLCRKQDKSSICHPILFL